MSRPSTDDGHGHLLRPEDYLDPEVLARERARCFLDRWTFACLRGDVPRHQDFVTVEIAGRSVFVQNVHGELRAFSNVCPHRFSALRCEGRGNGPIQCPYHRWTFDGDGALTGIPLGSQFSHITDEQRRTDYSLERWRLDTCGELVFVTLGAAPRPLREELGSDHDRIVEITRAFAETILRHDTVLHTNWKVVMQNTLEFYHVPSVHPETFAPLTPKVPALADHHAPAPHLSYVSHLKSTASDPPISPRRRAVAEMLERIYATRPVRDFDGYFHYLFFPNLTLGTADGRSFALFRYSPIDPDHTRLEITLVASRFETNGPVEAEALTLAYGQMSAFTLQVAEEDRVICEAVQRGLRSVGAHHRGTFGDGEFLVRRFQENYVALMGEPGVALTRA